MSPLSLMFVVSTRVPKLSKLLRGTPLCQHDVTRWMYWEYERGIRHYLYPGLLAIALVTLDALRVEDPVHQAIVIRVLMGLAVLAVMGWAAREWIREGKPVAGLALLTLTAFSPDMIFIEARTLSETAMMIPLVLGGGMERQLTWVRGRGNYGLSGLRTSSAS